MIFFKKRYKVSVYQGSDSRWYVRATARNGEIVFDAQGHSRREDAVRSAVMICGGRFVLSK